MKLLFLNPPFSKYNGVEGHGGRVTPLNLGYLAAYLRQQKPQLEISVLDCEALMLSYEQITDFLNKFGPDIVAITLATPAYYNVMIVAQIIKNFDKNCQIIVGGPHPTALPKELLQEEKNLDFAVIGEGEITLLELVEAIENKKDFRQVKGIAFRESGSEIIMTPPRPLIEDLDMLPFPAKDIMPMHAYFLPPTKRITGGNSTNMISSRGCPFGCTFCMAQTVWGRRTRARSVKNVVDEIAEDVQKYDSQDIVFHDEFFTVNRQRVFDFCDELKKRKLNINWYCQARAGAIDAVLVEKMKESGCAEIGFGFESGNQRILNLMNKNNSVEKAIESADICKKAGIKVYGSFILGYPGETKESIEDTLKLAKRVDCDTAGFFIAAPYPGTELFRLALEKGYIKRPIDWKLFAPLSKDMPPMDIPGMTKEELIKYKKRVFRSFYLRPKYIFKRFRNIRNVADIKGLIEGLNILKQVAK